MRLLLLSVLALSLRAQTAVFTFTDALGAADIRQAHALLTSNGSGVLSCYLVYSQNDGYLGLLDDAGGTPATWTPLGGAGVLTNSQCSIKAAGVTVATAGNTLTLSVTITPSAFFIGIKTLMTFAYSQANIGSGWATLGRLTLPGNLFTLGGSNAFLWVDALTLDMQTAIVPTLGSPNKWAALQTMLAGLSLLTTNGQPACAETAGPGTLGHGSLWYLNGGAAKDSFQVCVFNGKAYAWVTLY